MSTSLGFNPDPAIAAVWPNMKLLVQANTPLTIEDTRNTLCTLDIIEAFDIAREIILGHITPEEVTLNRGTPKTINRGKKYRKDKEYKLFWQDVISEVEEALNTHFSRTIELSTGTKISVHPMIRRVMKLTIFPILQEFSQYKPSMILSILDKNNRGMEGKDIFGYMSRFMSCGDVELHVSNILVARKLLQKNCNSQAQKHTRLRTIQNITEKVQERVQ